MIIHDTIGTAKKKETWERIASEFNAGLPEEGRRRDTEALRKKYSNLKTALNKKVAQILRSCSSFMKRKHS